MTIRGKNLAFLNSVFGALQIDSIEKLNSPVEFKRAFTPTAVREIYSSVSQFWPSLDNYERALQKSASGVTALYTGSYTPEDIFRAITKHCLYSEKIYLLDPFLDPTGIRDQFNPLLHPEEHRANAIQFTHLWIVLFPWIEAGLVEFVRPLSDFVPGLYQETLRIQKARFESHPTLKAASEKQADEYLKKNSENSGGMMEYYFLSHPDNFFQELYRNQPDHGPFKTEDEFLAFVRDRRENHPYFVDKLPGQKSEFLMETSGANYEAAKQICSISNSHIVTDLRSRWMEIELDRKVAGIDEDGWSPFAKALQNAELSILSDIPLEAALRLRKENRLETMRLFFRKLWQKCASPDAFSETNAIALAAELNERIAESKDEWSKIDQDLLKWLGATSGSLVATSLIGFVPAASAGVVTGVTSLIQARMKRTNFKDRYPAGFFLNSK